MTTAKQRWKRLHHSRRLMRRQLSAGVALCCAGMEVWGRNPNDPRQRMAALALDMYLNPPIVMDPELPRA